MAQRTATLHLRCAESSTPAGSPTAAINAHSGRGVVRPPRSFLAHRPLGRLFFRFAGPIACSSRQRLRFAQPLARRRMAAQRFCRLLTLSDLISALSEPVLRSVFGSSPAPLRGSVRQHRRPSGSCRQRPIFSAVHVIRGGAIPAAARGFSRQFVAATKSGGGGWWRCGSLTLSTHSPTHPLLAPGARLGSRRGASAPATSGSFRGNKF